MNDNDSDKRVGSLDRGLAILEYLATTWEAPIGEIAEAVAMSRSAAYRMMDRLGAAGYVTNVTNGRWRLGPASARLATTAVQSTDVAQVAPELLRLLVQQTRESCGVGVLSADAMVFIYRERGPQAVTVHAELGARRPLHCTAVGKAFLAALPQNESLALVRRLELARYTPNTITTRPLLEADLHETRRRGWSFERQEFNEESTCCGAAVLDHRGEAVAAISVAGLASRMEATFDRIGPIVASTAEAISRKLGHNPDAS